MERRKSSVILSLNAVADTLFKDNNDLAKEAVSLLAITEDDNDDLHSLVVSDWRREAIVIRRTSADVLGFFPVSLSWTGTKTDLTWYLQVLL